MRALINPGSGKVHDVSLYHAEANAGLFIIDINLSSPRIHFARDPDPWRNGRYRFYLSRLGHHGVMVDMPGCSHEHVRFHERTGVDPTRYYRLYIDESSWWWPFAVDIARRELTWPFGAPGENGEYCECRSCNAARGKES